MPFQDITIDEKSQGQRLDKFLAQKLTTQTRSQIKKMIKAGEVLVNGKPAKVHHFLKIGDVISTGIRNKELGIRNTKENLQATSYQLQPNIIFEDNDFLVLEKPAGLLVHPTEKGEKDTLVDWLVEKYPFIKDVGEEKYREGIIHRLDKDVSGIMVAAKTKKAYFHLKDQFKKRLVKKEYIALVYGKVTQHEREIDLPIGRNKDGQFVAHPRRGKDKLQDQDKIAKTKYKVIEYIKDYTLLSIQILTGRTHQIRAHLFAIGHPILGDPIYRPKKKFFHFLRRRIKIVNPGRIFLHSHKIGFNNLNNQRQEFESPLPKELTDFLNA